MCAVLDSSSLTATLPSTLEMNIGYDNTISIIGLSLYYSSHLSNEPVLHGSGTRWSGPLASKICEAENAEYIVDSITPKDIQGATATDGLLLDLTLIKSEDGEISCQVDLPSREIMDKSMCQDTMAAISNYVAIPEVSLDSMTPKIGINPVYLSTSGLTLTTPTSVLCRSRDTTTGNVAAILSKEILNVLKELKRLDTALGSKFLKKLDNISANCGNTDLEHLLQAELSPEEIDECFNLGLKANKRRKRDLNLVNMGSNGEDTTQMAETINQNFKKLTDNEKQLFKRLIAIGVEKDLQVEILDDHEENLRNIDDRIRGLEQSANIDVYHQEFLAHILQASSHSYQILDKLFKRIMDFEKYVSATLEAKETICLDLTCFSSDGIHINSNKDGLSVFIRGKMLAAAPGVTPACSMTSNQQISIHHLKHMDRVNTTHLKDGDNIIAVECLENYASCPKDGNIRSVVSHDLIDGNILLSPAKKGSFKIQCIKAMVLDTPTGYLRCEMTPKYVKLPITLPNSITIGIQDIQILPYNSPMTTLKEVGLKLFRSSAMKLGEMKTLASHTWDKLTDVSQVNPHHMSFAAGFFLVVVGIAVCLCLCYCLTHTLPDSCVARKNKMKFNLKWKFWKRRDSNGSAEIEAISTSSGENEAKNTEVTTVQTYHEPQVPNAPQTFHEPQVPNAPQIFPAPGPSNMTAAGQDGQMPGRGTRMYLDLGSLTSRLQ